VDESAITQGLHDFALSQARSWVDHLQRHKGYNAVHNAMSEYIAYAVEMGEFSEEEKNRIPMEHGESLEKFCRRYRDDDVEHPLVFAVINFIFLEQIYNLLQDKYLRNFCFHLMFVIL
jgi:hypothetical protein